MNDTSLAYAMSQIPLHVGVAAAALVAAAVALSVTRANSVETSESPWRRAAAVGLPLVVLGALLFLALGRAWAYFERLEDETEREATAVLALERQARQLPQESHREARRLLGAYARRVVDEEFPAMSRGERPPSRCAELEALTELWVHAPVAPEYVGRAHDALDLLYALRRTRHGAVDPLVPPSAFVLGLLLLLASVRAASEVLHGPRGMRFLVTALVVFVVLTAALLVNQFSLPFAGDLTVDVDAFLDVANELR